MAGAELRPIAQHAGGLLSKAGLASSHAVDAFVVATALEFDAAVIATGDPADMKRLAAPHRNLRVYGTAFLVTMCLLPSNVTTCYGEPTAGASQARPSFHPD